MNVSLKNENIATCCFFGHKRICNESKVRGRLKSIVEQKIRDGYTEFLMGNHGEFDRLALTVCRELRNTYQQISITVAVTTLAIFVKKRIDIESFPEWERQYVSETELINSVADDLYGDVKTITYSVEEEYFKNRILKTNKFMVDESDFVIGYINPKQTQSGAKRAFNYAKRVGKETINIFDEEDNRNCFI